MKGFRNILCVLGQGDGEAMVLAEAARIAELNDAELVAVYPVQIAQNARFPELQLAIGRSAQEYLESLVDELDLPRSLQVTSKVLQGRPFIEVIREVLRNERDLVIKREQRDKNRALGAVDLKLLRKCPCPVWLMQAAMDLREPLRVLVAIDIDPDNHENDPLNRKLLTLAADLASDASSIVNVVHAWEIEHEALLRSPRIALEAGVLEELMADQSTRRYELLMEAVARAGLTQGQGDEPMLIQGSPAEVVPEIAASTNADVVVMGTVGRTGIPGLVIGNTAERILAKIDCSILAVKPDGFVSPVTLEDH